MSSAPTSTADLAAGLADVVGGHLGRAVAVEDLRRLSGGSSHETWGFVAVDAGGTGAGPVPLVLRREFERSLLDTDVRVEYDLLRALHDAGIPVPEPFVCAVEDSPLGLPFIVMERSAGTDLRKDLARPGHGRDLAALGARAVELQGRIHGVDPDRLPGLGQAFGPQHEIARWAAVIEAALIDGGKLHVDPLLATALAWLRTNPPPAAPACVVHGDFKANNMLIDPGGSLTIIDWELAHLGDPVEDLAWTMLWRTEWDVVGGLHTETGYTAAYTQLTGREVDPEVLRFWRIFSLVKLWAIFITGMTGERVRPTLRLMGRAMVWLADQMAQELAEAVGP